MAFTLYGLYDNNAVGSGPWKHGATSVTDFAALTSPTTYYVLGWMDNQNAKMFWSSNGLGQGGACPLPTLALPNANTLPNGALPLAASGYVYATTYAGYEPSYAVSGSGDVLLAQAGLLYFSVLYSTSSPEQGSPVQFSMSPYGVLLIDSSVTEQWL